jgi:hypothetical protein
MTWSKIGIDISMSNVSFSSTTIENTSIKCEFGSRPTKKSRTSKWNFSLRVEIDA